MALASASALAFASAAFLASASALAFSSASLAPSFLAFASAMAFARFSSTALALAALASACALALASDSALCCAWRSAVALAFESSVSLAADAARAASPALMVRWRAASSDAARFSAGEARVSPAGDDAGAEAGSGATLASAVAAGSGARLGAAGLGLGGVYVSLSSPKRNTIEPSGCSSPVARATTAAPRAGLANRATARARTRSVLATPARRTQASERCAAGTTGVIMCIAMIAMVPACDSFSRSSRGSGVAHAREDDDLSR